MGFHLEDACRVLRGEDSRGGPERQDHRGRRPAKDSRLEKGNSMNQCISAMFWGGNSPDSKILFFL